jgi:pimeloyl-ACP methyl ester carboxylesterase
VRAGFVARFAFPVEALSGLTHAAQITCPVLVVHDAEDESVPFAHARELQELLPQGVLHATHGLGHNRLLRDPATVAAVVDFLGTAMARPL